VIAFTILTDPAPGLYRHYKGGFFRLLFVAAHHEHDGRRVAFYLDLARGTLEARQVWKTGPDDREDCWMDWVPEALGQGVLMSVRRFTPVNDVPPGVDDDVEQVRREAASVKDRLTRLREQVQRVLDRCRDCHGSGEHGGTDGRLVMPCTTCNGSGFLPRAGWHP
jgi:hypothetical protein